MTTPTWLADFLKDAAENKWCNRIGCSTCGGQDFRSALARNLCERTATDYPPARNPQRFLLSDLSSEDFSNATEVGLADLSAVTLEDLAQIDEIRRDFDMGMIFSELGGLPLKGELRSHYGAIYEEERAAAAARTEAAAKKRASDHRAALERRGKREATAIEHAKRGKARCARRLDVIAQLSIMSVEDRMVAIAEDRFGLALDGIPFDLLKYDSTVIAKAAPSTRIALAKRIDQRGGPYRALRKALEDGKS